MKKSILLLLLAAVILTSCNAGGESSSAAPASVESQQASSVISQQSQESSEQPQEVEPDNELYADIMRTFGADEIQLESGETGCITSIISFYYNREGISSAEEITGYGFYGWYAEYVSRLSDELGVEIDEIFPEKTVVYTTDDGEVGFVADTYEDVVTSFFNVTVEELRSTDLYHGDKNAYIPETGPGIGERPTVTLGKVKDDGELIELNVVINEGSQAQAGEDGQEYSMVLTVTHDSENVYAPYKFVSILPKN